VEAQTWLRLHRDAPGLNHSIPIAGFAHRQGRENPDKRSGNTPQVLADQEEQIDLSHGLGSFRAPLLIGRKLDHPDT
jgi:hypothetical protein